MQMNGFNPESREQTPTAEFSEPGVLPDIEVIRAGVVEFFGPDSRYPAHNDAMVQSLEEDGLASPGMVTAVELHDLVDHGLVNPKDEQTYAKALQLFSSMYEGVEDKHRFIYGTLCALSVSMFEQNVAESWRTEELGQFSDRSPEEVAQIHALVNKDRSVDVDEDFLKTVRVSGLVDTTKLKDGLNSLDVEGLEISGVELEHNLQNRPKNNPASVNRDFNEVLYAYAPALILAGSKKRGAQLRGSALEYFHDDPEIVEKAKAQKEKSEKHYDEVQELFSEALAKSLDAIATARSLPGLRDKMHIIGRIKTEGSLREKLSSAEYEGVDSAPDGIGFRIVVLDQAIKSDKTFNPTGDLDSKIALELYTNQLIKDIGENMSSALTGTSYEAPFGESDDHTGEFKAVSRGSFLPSHPKGDHHIDNSIDSPRKSGYSAYHVTFEYVVDGFDTVPMEVQIVSATQEERHTYDEASEIWYKAGKKPSQTDLENFRVLARRSEQMKSKPNNEEVRPQGFFRLLKHLPNLRGVNEFDTAVHRNFTYAEGGSARLLIPKQMEGYIDEAFIEEAEIEGDIILPVNEISEEDFFEIIRLVSPSLATDEKIREAINFVRGLDLKPRRDGISVIEGHLLPTTLNAVMLASASSKHWDSDDSVRYLRDKALVAIFHDVVEDTKGRKAKQEKRDYIRSGYGPRVAGEVDSMTSPGHIIDDHLRRRMYARQLANDRESLLAKSPDRMQNIMADIIRLLTTSPSSKEIKKISDYEEKTADHLEPVLMEPGVLPKEHRESFKTTMAVIRSLLDEAAK